jgi:hypothetical protein
MTHFSATKSVCLRIAKFMADIKPALRTILMEPDKTGLEASPVKFIFDLV